MSVKKKIFYVLMSLSMLPIIGGYFAYGNTRDLIFLGITVLWTIGLIISAFKQKNSSFIRLTFVLGLLVLSDTVWGLRAFFDDGSDSTVAVLFSLQAVFMLIVLFFLWKDSKLLKQSK
jgi:hypothetical protein